MMTGAETAMTTEANTDTETHRERREAAAR